MSMDGDGGRPDRVAVITVHGTGDTASSIDGDKWFQRGSHFTERLIQRLVASGVNAEVIPHFWSGANSARAREEGAVSLRKLVEQCAKTHDSVHIIGHSHGGNVANDAAERLNWGWSARRNPLTSISTVGTPFFQRRPTGADATAAYAFLIIAALAGVSYLIRFARDLLPRFSNVYEQWRGEGNNALAVFVQRIFDIEIAVGIVVLYFVLVVATRGAMRTLRGRRTRSRGEIFTIWHPNDEAISFLQNVSVMPVEAFARGALFRGSQTMAIAWSVGAVLLSLLYFSWQGWGVLSAGIKPDALFFTTLLTQFSDTTLIFAFVYLVVRFCFGLVPEYSLRSRLNSSIGGALRGMAFGRDSDERLSAVAAVSYSCGARSRLLEGDIATRMQEAANSSVNRLIEKYRWALFTVSGDGSAALRNMAIDAMTWDSLIHTTYFDQPEVADMIADHIAEEAKRAPAR
jgi:hypothetical protein